MVTGPHIAGETRRGRDYLQVTIVMTVMAADVGQAAVIAWRVFRRAAGDDIAGWDLVGASAEVWPPSTRRGQARRLPGRACIGTGTHVTEYIGQLEDQWMDQVTTPWPKRQ